MLIISTTNGQVNFQKTFSPIDRYIDSLMKDWNLPGLALGIVYKDQLIYGKGYGFRDLEKKLPVQTNTLFPIASNSKLFTATIAVMLAEEGKMNLDKPVRSYMPSLNFSNDDLNAKVTMRDMLSHRTGLPRYDELSNALYGLGRTIQTYKGLKITSHTGSIDGFYSSLLFVPALGIGIFMINNGERGGSLRAIMTLSVLDRLLGLSYTPWSQRYMLDYQTARTTAKRFADSIKATRVIGTVPSHALSDYSGTYESQLFGSLQIKHSGDSLHLSFRKIQTPLTHFHYDQFISKEEKTDTPNLRLNFLTNDKGEIDRVMIGLGEGQEIFTRKKG